MKQLGGFLAKSVLIPLGVAAVASAVICKEEISNMTRRNGIYLENS